MRGLLLALTLVGVGAAGCGGPVGGEPAETATSFWEAMSAGELERARSHASRASAPLLDEWREGYAIGATAFGATLRNETAAVVETTLTTGGGDFELHPSFQTHLVREEGAWRVDVARTRSDLERAVLAAAAARVRSALAEGVHELGEALEEGVQQLEDALRDAVVLDPEEQLRE